MMANLIVGCGYLGRRVARLWLADGRSVAGVTRRPQQAAQLQQEGLHAIVADVTRPETLAGLPPAETVLYAVARDRDAVQPRHELYVDGLRAALDALSPRTGRIIFVSSTGVYGQTDGSWVDETSPCRPQREAGRVFLAAEQILAEHALGSRAVVLRMAGIYGPGRIPLRAQLLSGEPIAVPSESLLNLIHVDDAAAVVLAAEAHAAPPVTYVVSDGHPVERRAYFTGLAELLASPPPKFVEPPADAPVALRAAANKRVANARMLDELHVRLMHPTYRQGLAAIVLRAAANNADENAEAGR